MATIKDVAERAGVTVTTVSRVLNNRGYISEATRRKVYLAMEELDYRPNELARSFHKNSSRLIGLIVPTVANPFFGELTSYVETSAYEHGYKILICNSHFDPDQEKQYVEMLKSNLVQGIILGSTPLNVSEFSNLKYPIVTFDYKLFDFPYIRSDNYEGGRIATELLIRKGCKKLAHICGNLRANMFGVERYQAFQHTASAYGVETVVVETDTMGVRREDTEAAVRNLFDRHPDVDGVFVSSDLVAYCVMNRCLEIGKSVPEELKIVGYDNIAITSLVKPYLSTVGQPLQRMAACAVETILRQIAGEPIQIDNKFAVELIERETT
ncbi:LacI family transcriptional regulator [Alicyclobacillus sacchari]|uniref:LacI family transcriptional regulator n=1 Tax=Alicyclobacillus sacchari TaxID=392010 RepID=A0A4R8LDR3_9BACL|nr:LacI family DNA-binding transcriptional regulator [Alicyclobacillus sacchari]TDY40240.1 LacI family transcriptional regulator [Alicyclobacillus sacchari]GMA59375.1 LacI family transcriptional regulator [Alicyclobacillus sacchari]